MEVVNNDKAEINIGNWKIKGVQSNFIFPQDTIISSNNRIILSKEDFHESSSTERISLCNPSGREVAYYNNENIEQQNSPDISKSNTNQNLVLATSTDVYVVLAEKLLTEYKARIAIDQTKNDIVKYNKDMYTIENTDNNTSNEDIIIQTASALDSIDSSSTKSFWSRAINIPVQGIKSLIRMFYDF